MKRSLAALTAALSLALISSASAASLTVGFSQIGSESGWRAAETALTKQEAEKRGYTLKFADAQQKQENQIKAVRGFIAQGVDAILIAPVVSTGWDAVLKEAKEAEIPVVLLDRQIDSPEDLYLTAVTSDQVHEGKVAGDWLVKDVGDKPCNVVELQGTTGSSPAINRKKGFEDAIRGTTTSRSPVRRPVTSPAPRARKSWKASSRPKAAARISAPSTRIMTTWPSAPSRPSRKLA